MIIFQLKLVFKSRRYCNFTTTTDSDADSESDSDFYKNSILVFERKTTSDLLASINDGRYREQNPRLLANLSKHKICYLIENKLDKNAEKYRKNAAKIVKGAIINKIFRDDIKYIKTDDLQEKPISTCYL